MFLIILISCDKPLEGHIIESPDTNPFQLNFHHKGRTVVVLETRTVEGGLHEPMRVYSEDI
jgi:hypothetical protein